MNKYLKYLSIFIFVLLNVCYYGTLISHHRAIRLLNASVINLTLNEGGKDMDVEDSDEDMSETDENLEEKSNSGITEIEQTVE